MTDHTTTKDKVSVSLITGPRQKYPKKDVLKDRVLRRLESVGLPEEAEVIEGTPDEQDTDEASPEAE
jgi:hypothetical protein